MSAIRDFLHAWQTLTAGLLALLGAVLTVWIMNKKFSYQKATDEKRFGRRFRAALATLPADLATVMAYTQECMEITKSVLSLHRHNGETLHITIPLLPERVTNNLQALIEALEDEGNTDALVQLLRSYQVQRSRLNRTLKGPNAHSMTPSSMRETLMDSIRLYLRAEGMFDFARENKESIPEFNPTRNDVKRAIVYCRLRDNIGDEDQFVRKCLQRDAV